MLHTHFLNEDPLFIDTINRGRIYCTAFNFIWQGFLQEKFRYPVRKLRQKRRLSFTFLVQYPTLQFPTLSGILFQTKTNDGRTAAMMLSAVQTMKSASMSRFISVFVDIDLISVGR